MSKSNEDAAAKQRNIRLYEEVARIKEGQAVRIRRDSGYSEKHADTHRDVVRRSSVAAY